MSPIVHFPAPGVPIVRSIKTYALLFLSVVPIGAVPPSLAQDASAARGKAAASQAHVLTRAELDQLLAQPGKVLIVDVRRPDEIASVGGLPVYLNVQLAELPHSYDWIPKDRTIVTLSNHAARARKAAELLTSAGFHVAGAA